MTIQIAHLWQRFGAFAALRDVSLSVPAGELVAVLGPSGSGKTTLLRVIAGLEPPDAGSIHIDGEDATALSARERRVGFVFQHYALFKHMSVFENVAFGLRVRPRATRPPESVIRQNVRALLERMELDGLAGRRPSQLSGGQRQRVALARALAVEPRLLLLDEPFGALDARVRQDLRRWLRRLQEELRITTVLVTHDQEEALEVATRVVVMRQGQIEQTGTPQEVYDHPATPFVYTFLGDANRFEAHTRGGRLFVGGAEVDAKIEQGAGKGESAAVGSLATAAAQVDRAGTNVSVAGVDNAASTLVPDGPVVAYARPHDLALERHRPHAGGEALCAQVTAVHVVGPVARVELHCTGASAAIQAELPRHDAGELALVAGDYVHLRPRRVRLFARD